MSTEIVIVTPCLNAASTIDQTIQSVLSQAGRFRIRYHVQDGGSTDGTWARVLWWQEALARGDWPVACDGVGFSCHQGPDNGLYDALVTALGAVAPTPDAFLSWINADDIFLPGSLALIAAADQQFPTEAIQWIGGGAAVLRHDVIVAAHDRELPTAVIREGLCDHDHWHFVQQEGTFFRARLWDAVDPDTHIRPMTYAGDWNLWRRFAQRAELVQTGRALAAFRIRDGQLSIENEAKYRAEMDRIVSPAQRDAAFRDLVAGPPPTRLRLESRFASDALTLIEERVDARLYTNRPDAFGEAPFEPERRVRMKGAVRAPAPAISYKDGRLGHIARGPGVIALDHGWQYPAITEEHAFRRISETGGLPEGAIYVGYPWASLIDHLQADGVEKDLQQATFTAFCAQIPTDGIRITVCQHVLAKWFLPLFERAGIDHVFWSHATHDDVADRGTGPALHPFPLYPVQVPADDPKAPAARHHLFSFIGARSDPHYLTDVRSAILDRLADHPKGLIQGREAWHYHRVVYRHQIRQANKADQTPEAEARAEDEFRAALGDSTFALCPSGSGPNSIRLWEALGAGAIPVILSETHALPGDPDLWDAAAVFCDETVDAVDALPARLETLFRDPAALTRMQTAGRALWDLYGPESFVTDIRGLADRLTNQGIPDDRTDLAPLIRRVLHATAPDLDDAELLLALATAPGRRLDRPGLARALGRARARLGQT